MKIRSHPMDFSGFSLFLKIMVSEIKKFITRLNAVIALYKFKVSSSNKVLMSILQYSFKRGSYDFKGSISILEFVHELRLNGFRLFENLLNTFLIISLDFFKKAVDLVFRTMLLQTSRLMRAANTSKHSSLKIKQNIGKKPK